MNTSKPALLVQITDCHLQPEPDQSLYGYNPEQRLVAVVEHIRKNQPAPDLLLLSGDLAHQGYEQTYRRLIQHTATLAEECIWLPGNHDNASQMAREPDLSRKVYHLPGWTLLMLDSTANPDGHGRGELADSELVWLETQLKRYADRPLLVALHHPPLPIGTPWQDAIMLANAERFWEVAAGCKALKLVLCGHLHREHQLCFEHIRVFSTPATAPQFKAMVAELEIEQTAPAAWPAYRVVELGADGSFATHVVRVGC